MILMKSAPKTYTYTATCTRVIDADTIVFEPLDLGNDVFLRKCIVRFYGINAYESRTKNPQEKEKGLAAKKFIKDLIEGKEVTFESIRREKYGRLLGKVYFEGKCLNDELVRLGHAVVNFYNKK